MILINWYFIRLIFANSYQIDILSDQLLANSFQLIFFSSKCWKIIEKVVFVIILLGFRHKLGGGCPQIPIFTVFYGFKVWDILWIHSRWYFIRFIVGKLLSDWFFPNSYRLIFFSIKNVGISTKRLA